jgi:hypothetical protein
MAFCDGLLGCGGLLVACEKAALSKTVLTFADEEDEAALDALQDLEAQQATQPQSEQQKKGREEEKGLTQASARDRVRTATIDK